MRRAPARTNTLDSPSPQTTMYRLAIAALAGAATVWPPCPPPARRTCLDSSCAKEGSTGGGCDNMMYQGSYVRLSLLALLLLLACRCC